jgi:sulfatase modifying factor 1
MVEFPFILVEVALADQRGVQSRRFPWGDAFEPNGRPVANTWQGEFPWQNLLTDGYEGTSPLRAFPPNGYGLYDMIGNVWEWTTDWYVSTIRSRNRAACRKIREGLAKRIVTIPAYRTSKFRARS